MEPALLHLSLLGLIPLAIVELSGASTEQRQTVAAAAADAIASRADQMLFPAPKAKPSGVLAHLARGLAAAAYQPGGITALGLHVCLYAHPYCPVAPGERARCCTCEPGRCALGTDRSCLTTCRWCAHGCATDGSCCRPPSLWGRITVVGE
ncbi:hypothetical protein GCM10010156_49820 [Planobispora rosea]|uniref:Uncharacterized protein n=1 Tax=Planobispora rosea TaxID=35762 RepID=A0A8J3WEQ4_PLARO|nr:hypothetical protein [Planobispora rosea]GGS85238.1 hypothetical protein GCM10010156_49820 [Planobispora rosea]GIH86493.1 hypothetical protein Pro02_49010 [Planobispora rosea]